jgi:acyl-CoA thioesterase-2
MATHQGLIDAVALTELFELESLDCQLFRGKSWDLGFPAVFGGQVLGQALLAAYQTVAPGQIAHSFHSYFLLPGDVKHPILYDVENVRDGRSFATRRIKAMQHGKNIFYMTASFQYAQPHISHQDAGLPDDLPAPDSLPNDVDEFAKKIEPLTDEMRRMLSYHKPIDVRTVNVANAFGQRISKPQRYIWMRAQHALANEVALHQAAMAYASDYHFLSTALQAHDIKANDKRLRMATIDHAMWFHQPVDFNAWHTYATHSPFSGNARALVNGQFIDGAGQLIASTAQEGMIRLRD